MGWSNSRGWGDGSGWYGHQVQPFSIAFQSSATSSAQTTTIDFGTMTYGSGNTRVIVGIEFVTNAGSACTVTGITIGGVSLTQVSGAAINGGTSSQGLDVWMSSAPLAGSSGDVQVTFSSAPNAFGSSSSVGLYSLVTTTPTPANSNTANNFAASISLSSFAVPSGGGGIVITGGANATSFSSFTNAALDATQTRNNIYGHISATGTPTITATFTGSDSLFVSAVSWGP